MCEDYHSIFDICQEKKTRCSLPHQKGKPFHEESDYAPPCAQHLPQGIGPGSEDFWTKRNLQGLIHRSPCRAGTTNFTAKVANIYIQTSRESVLDRFQKKSTALRVKRLFGCVQDAAALTSKRKHGKATGSHQHQSELCIECS